MNAIFVIPTGVGCRIGGHAGDALPAAKLIASVCDNLIVHPNVVNAAYTNEMTENMLYVEGSMLDSFLLGKISLQKVYGNSILFLVNKITDEMTNYVNAAKHTIGVSIEMREFPIPLEAKGWVDQNGLAGGEISGISEAGYFIEECKLKYPFDAIAIATSVGVDEQIILNYLSGKIRTNPWGKAESLISSQLSYKFKVPVAHAPVEYDSDFWLNYEKKHIILPRQAAEMSTSNFIHCVFKGLHKAPRISQTSRGGVSGIDWIIIPDSVDNNIYKSSGVRIMSVKSNKHCAGKMKHSDIDAFAADYVEAAGMLCAYKSGIDLGSVIFKK